MSRILLSIISIIILISSGYAQWNILNEGGSFRTIDFIDDQTGWIGRAKTLMKTENGGKTWSFFKVDFTFKELDFINESAGWALGYFENLTENIVFRTMDGGQTWDIVKQYKNPSYEYEDPSYLLFDLYVVNENVIYTLEGTRGLRYDVDWSWSVKKTTDAGLNWETILFYEQGLHTDFIECVISDINGNTWIGSWGGGIAMFDGSNWNVYNKSNSDLPDNNVVFMESDLSGNIWIGTHENGLVMFDGSNWTSYNESNSGLPSNEITSIASDDSGNIWIGTCGGGLAKFDGSNWTVYNESNSGLPDNCISCLTIDSKGNKWIGTIWSGLAMFNGSSWNIYNTSTSALPDNEIKVIAIDSSDNKWIGTYYGVAMFDDDSWTVYDTSNSGLPGNPITSIAIDNNNSKWIGTIYDGVSMFDGSNWNTYNAANSSLPNDQVSSIAIDKNGNKWIGTMWGGLAMFDGSNWTLYQCDSYDLESIDFYNQEIGIITGLFTSYKNNGHTQDLFVLRTTDGGNIWEPLDYSAFNNMYDIQFINGSTSYFKGRQKSGAYTFFKTTDTFSNWLELTGDYNIRTYYALNTSTIFAVVKDSLIHVLKSTDGGYNWEKKDEIYTFFNSWYGGIIYFSSANSGFTFNENILYSSIDGGNSWHISKLNNPIQDVCFLDEKRGFITSSWYHRYELGGGHYEGDLFSTNDGGKTWQPDIDLLEYGKYGYFGRCHFINKDIGFLLTQYHIYKTSNSGNTWTEVFPGDYALNYQFTPSDISFKNEQTGWIVVSLEWADSSTAGIFGTTDGGEDWELVWKYSNPDSSQYSLNSIYFINSTGWAVGSGGLIVKYTDQDRWQEQPFVTDLPLNKVFYADEQHGWITSGSVLLTTKDGGQSWDEKAFDKYQISDMYFADSLHGWAVGYDTTQIYSSDGVIIETFDGGQNWNAVVENLAGHLNSIYFKDGIGWAAGENGLLLTTSDAATWVKQNTNTIFPDKFRLFQNYPNPFNPKTVISWQLAVSSHVDLSIYNILGQKVATLVNKKQSAGSYKVEWDATGFASGVYLYKLETLNGYRQVKKLVLLK